MKTLRLAALALVLLAGFLSPASLAGTDAVIQTGAEDAEKSGDGSGDHLDW